MDQVTPPLTTPSLFPTRPYFSPRGVKTAFALGSPSLSAAATGCLPPGTSAPSSPALRPRRVRRYATPQPVGDGEPRPRHQFSAQPSFGRLDSRMPSRPPGSEKTGALGQKQNRRQRCRGPAPSGRAAVAAAVRRSACNSSPVPPGLVSMGWERRPLRIKNSPPTCVPLSLFQNLTHRRV